MQLKNYQEDLVLHVIQIALEDRPEIQAGEAFVHDVAAYTLNRLPPRYIQSERGFTRLAVAQACDDDANGELARMVEMLLLVNRAIDIVRGRRESGADPDAGDGPPQATASRGAALQAAAAPRSTLVPTELGYWHNYPYLLGRVLDAKTGEPVYGVTVTAWLDGEPALPTEAGWRNPYCTLPATQGYYSFLLRAIQSTEEKKQSALRITFEHPAYRPAALEKALRTQGEFEVHTTIASEDILNLPAVRLVTRS